MSVDFRKDNDELESVIKVSAQEAIKRGLPPNHIREVGAVMAKEFLDHDNAPVALTAVLEFESAACRASQE